MKEDFKCNVLIMGKTGTGKSTLLNYICDANIAQTGTGKPVTGEGIYEYTVGINGQEVRLFDSWGIEAGKVDCWKKLIAQSLQDHGVHKKMEDWFHSVIYCIQAGGGRVEDIDSEIIRMLLADGYALTVVLTKADQVDEISEAKLKESILNELQGYIPSSCKGRINIVSTCAEKKKTRAGVTQPFGKEEVQRAILVGWKESVIERLPKHVVARLCEIVDDWRDKEIAKISDMPVSGISRDNEYIYNLVNNDAKEFCEDLRDKYLKSILTDVIETCRKTNLSLEAMLNFNLGDLNAENRKDDDMWLQVILLILPFGYHIYRAASNSIVRIMVETQHIKEYINKIADNIKSNCQSLESDIEKELNKVL